jgi:branched-chain amino acid transport system permease protein
MDDWINTLGQGLLLGGMYALFATGLSLSFGIMRLINVAHGDFIVLAAFAAIALVEPLAIGPFATLPLVVLLMAGFGYLLQRLFLNRTLGEDPLRPLLVTFGVSIVIQNALLEIFSADMRGLDAGPIETASIPLGGSVAVGVFPLLVAATAVGVIGALQWLFYRTALGRAFRATADDHRTAQLMGIDNRRVYALAMALATAVVAVAGIYLAIRSGIGPSDGPQRLLCAFEAVAIGGLGSLWGTLAGGMILGVAQAVGLWLDPGWGAVSGHLAFLLVVVLRPNGLFPKTRDK